MPDLKRLVRLLLGDHRDPRQELADIFGSPVPSGGSAQPEAVRWARQVLTDRSVPSSDSLRAVAVLREVEPRLGLRSAVYLARQIAP